MENVHFDPGEHEPVDIRDLGMLPGNRELDDGDYDALVADSNARDIPDDLPDDFPSGEDEDAVRAVDSTEGDALASQTGDRPNDPPSHSGAETGFSEPGKGRKLQQVADYGAVAGEQFRAAVAERKTIAEGGIESLTLLENRGVSLEEAGDLLQPREDMELRAEVASVEAEHAALQYGDALVETGLQLRATILGVDVEMVDPARFTAALQEVEQPEDSVTEENLASQMQVVIDDAMDRAGKAIVMQYADEARLIFGDKPPKCDAFVEHDEGYRPSDEDIALADNLPQYAEAIAEEFERIDGHPATQEGIEQLAAAQHDNMILEWGIGRHLGIIGDQDMVVGVARLADESDWDAVCSYLAYLKARAPEAAFPTIVRDAILRDIDHALQEVPRAMDSARDEMRFYHGGYDFYDEPAGTYGIRDEQLEGDSTIPTLRAARDRVRAVFGM